ncbi:MAG: hypothetical protein HQ567_28065, partial [Candidatus Nealsonbacteria bacterium]|nr:hypothetical protein [Candidatus Nealsonbacteria bacterium]
MKKFYTFLLVLGLLGAYTSMADAEIIHRWGFDEVGNAGTLLLDSVGGATGTIIDVGGLDGDVGITHAGQVYLTGGDKNTADYVDLPDGLVSGLTDMTIETWATQHTVQNWSRIFDFGQDDTNNMMMSWTRGGDINTDRVAFKINVEQNLDSAMQPYTIDQQFHIVMTYDDDGNAGSPQILVYKDGAHTGTFNTDYHLSQLVDTNNWLGRSQYGDGTANASYNEFRIYNHEMTPAEITANFNSGPVWSTFVWEAAATGNWNDVSTWAGPPATLPDGAAAVEIGVGGYTVTVQSAPAAPALAGNLDVSDGSAVIVGAGQSLTVSGGVNVAAGSSVSLGDNASINVGYGTISSVVATGANATIGAVGPLGMSYSDNDAATVLTLQGGGKFSLDSVATVAGSSFQVNDGTTLVGSGANPLGAAETLILNGGTASIGDHVAAPAAGPDGALAHWGFEDAAGSSHAADTSNHPSESYNAELVGGVTFTTEGRVGSGMSFPGGMNSDEVNNPAYLDLPDGMDDFTMGITVAGWVKTDTVAHWARIIDFGNGPGQQNTLLARNATSNTLHFDNHGGIGPGPGIHAVPDTFKIGEWQHFAATIDNDAAHTAKIYVDGVEVSSSTQALPANANRINNYIGRSNWNDACFDGTMDELYIYDRALDAADIEAMAGVRTNPDMSQVDVTVTASSALESTSASALALRNVQLNDGATLATSGSAMSFESLSVVGGAGRTATIAHENSLDIGTYDDGGVVTTLVKAGSATLEPDSSKLTATATTFDVAAGTLKVSGSDPLGGSTQLRLSGGTFIFADVVGAQGTGTAPADQLVAHWAFDGAPGGVTPDATGTYNGTLMEEATITTDPAKVMVGTGALDLGYVGAQDGGYVDLPDGFDDFTGGITVSAWVLRESRTNWGRVMDFGNTPPGGVDGDNILMAQAGVSDNLLFGIHGAIPAGTEDGNMEVGGALGLNRWQHLVATIDDSHNGKMYVDGVEVLSEIVALPDDVVRTANYIGESGWAVDDFFDGVIDDMYVYDRALTAAEVGTMYAERTVSDFSAINVAVAADNATLESQSVIETQFASLTIEQSTTLHATGIAGVAFTGGTTVAAGATDVTLNAEVDMDLGVLDTSAEPGVNLVKTGLGAMRLSGATGSVASLNAAAGSLDTGGADVTISNHLKSGGLKYSIDTGSFKARGTDLVTAPDLLTVNGNVLTIVGEANRSVPTGAPADPFGYWSFDETGGTTLHDTSAGMHDGTLVDVDPSSAWVPGKMDGALNFDGINDNVSVDSLGADLSEVSVSVWVKRPMGNNAWKSIFHTKQWVAGDLHYVLTDRVLFASNGMQQQTGGNTDDFWTNGMIPEDDWAHMVSTYSVANGEVKVYVDGVLDREATILGTNPIAFTHGIWIGAGIPWGGRWMNGPLDELYIYDRALDQADVDALYGGGNGPAEAPAPPVTLLDTDVLVTAASTLNSAAPLVELRDLEVQPGVALLNLQGAAYSFQNVNIAEGVTINGEMEVRGMLDVADGIGNVTVDVDGELTLAPDSVSRVEVSVAGQMGDADKIILAGGNSTLLLGGELNVSSMMDRDANDSWSDDPVTIVDNAPRGSIGNLINGTGKEYDSVVPRRETPEDPHPHLGQGVFLRGVDYVPVEGAPQMTERVDLDLLIALGGDADGDGKVWLSDWAALRANFGNTGTGKTW